MPRRARREGSLSPRAERPALRRAQPGVGGGRAESARLHRGVPPSPCRPERNSVPGAHPLHFRASERVHGRARARLPRVSEGLPSPAPARTVGIRPHPSRDGPPLYARGVSRGGGAASGVRSGVCRDDRRDRRLSRRDGGGLRGDALAHGGGGVRQCVRLQVFAAARHAQRCA